MAHDLSSINWVGVWEQCQERQRANGVQRNGKRPRTGASQMLQASSSTEGRFSSSSSSEDAAVPSSYHLLTPKKRKPKEDGRKDSATAAGNLAAQKYIQHLEYVQEQLNAESGRTRKKTLKSGERRKSGTQSDPNDVSASKRKIDLREDFFGAEQKLGEGNATISGTKEETTDGTVDEETTEGDDDATTDADQGLSGRETKEVGADKRGNDEGIDAGANEAGADSRFKKTNSNLQIRSVVEKFALGAFVTTKEDKMAGGQTDDEIQAVDKEAGAMDKGSGSTDKDSGATDKDTQVTFCSIHNRFSPARDANRRQTEAASKKRKYRVRGEEEEEEEEEKVEEIRKRKSALKRKMGLLAASLGNIMLKKRRKSVYEED